MIQGAREAGLPAAYSRVLEEIEVYVPPEMGRAKVGAAVFLAVWGPVMGLMERITKSTLGDDGDAPLLVVWLVRATVWLVWLTHDFFFAPLCGRGDGRVLGKSASDTGALCNEKLLVWDEITPLL